MSPNEAPRSSRLFCNSQKLRGVGIQADMGLCKFSRQSDRKPRDDNQQTKYQDESKKCAGYCPFAQ